MGFLKPATWQATKKITTRSIGLKIQRFPAALRSDSLRPCVQVGEGNWH